MRPRNERRGIRPRRLLGITLVAAALLSTGGCTVWATTATVEETPEGNIEVETSEHEVSVLGSAARAVGGALAFPFRAIGALFD